MVKSFQIERTLYLEKCSIVFTGPEKDYDAITDMAARICNTPIALVTLLHENIQFFKSNKGLSFNQTPVEFSFCNHTVSEEDRVLIVHDTKEDVRFKNNPFVAGEPGIRFYAGASIINEDGIPLGAVCVMHTQLHQLSKDQVHTLKILADQTARLLELRKKNLELKSTEKFLEEKEKRLSRIINATRVGIWEWNISNNQVEINERWAEMLGYTLAELEPVSTETWAKLVHPDDKHISDTLVQKCLEKEVDHYDVEYRMIHKDGSIRWINDVGDVVAWTKDGEPNIMAGTHTDITARKKEQAELEILVNDLQERAKERECLYKITHLSNHVTSIDDLLSQAVALIPGGWQYTDIAEAQILFGEKIYKTPHFKKTPWIQTAERISRDNLKLVITVAYLKKSEPAGEGPFLLEERQLLETIADNLLLNILQIKSFHRVNLILESTGEGIYGIDTKGKCTFINTAGAEMIGYSPDECRGRNIHDLIHYKKENGEAYPENECPIVVNIGNKSGCSIDNEMFWRKDGTCFYVRYSSTPIYDGGKYTGSVVVFNDITENHKGRIALEQSVERFELINRAANDALYDWDIVKDEFYWNDSFYSTFQFEKTKSVFKLANWLDLTHPQDVEAHKERWDAFISDPNKEKWENEFRFKKADNTYIFVKEIGYVVRDISGKPIRMIGTLRDITLSKLNEIQKRYELEITHIFSREKNFKEISEDLLSYLSTVLQLDFCELWLTSVHGTHLNRSAYFAGTENGKNFFENAPHILSFKNGVGLPGKVWESGSTVLVHTDNDDDNTFVRSKTAWKNGIRKVFAFPLKLNENVIGSIIMGNTNEEQSESELHTFLKPLEILLAGEISRKLKEEEMFLLFESAPEILAIAAPNGKFTKVNPAFCKLLGYTEKELTEKPFADFIHPDDLNTTIQEYRETITGDRQASNFLNRYRSKTGKYKWISWSSSEVFAYDGLVFAYGRDVTNQVELRNLLYETNKLAGIGSWDIDLEKDFVWWSDMVHEIHETDPASFTPDFEKAMSFVTDEYKQILVDSVEKCMQTGQPFDLEMLISTTNSNKKWVRCLGKAEYLNGTPIRIFGSFQDIHKRKSAELKMQELLNEKNAILDSIGDGFFAVRNDFTVTYWNRMAENLLKTNRDSIVGKNLWDVFNDATNLDSFSIYNKAIKSRETIHFEDFYPVINRWFEISAYPSEEGLSVYFRDITERKTIEDQIKKSNERFEKVAEATNDAIWDWNIEQDNIYWGKGITTLFGYQEKYIDNTTLGWIGLIHPDDRQRIEESLKKLLEGEDENNWSEEYRFLKSSGDYAFVQDRGVTIRNKKGKIIRMVGAISDITYRKNYEDELIRLNESLRKYTKELENSNEELEQFAFIASHDLQEPLRMITSFLNQLERKYGPRLDDRAKQYIFFANDGAKRMKQVILDLLEYSRAGRDFEILEEIDLNEVLSNYQHLRRRVIEEKNVEILYEKLPAIRGYRAPIMQTLHCLLDNAMTYSKDDTPPIVHIFCNLIDNKWTIEVRDNGIGIENHYLEKIFIIFQRLHNRTESSGTGIGLSIVKKNVESWGGEVFVESTPGKGSSFYFTVPETT